MTAETFSVSRLAKRWQVRRERVKGLIEQGLLPAFDLTPTGSRRTYRVSPEAVHYSKKKPDDAVVAVKHRGYWFYVSDCDLDSKSTFNLLLELINLEIRAGGGAQIPLLTI